MKPPRASLPGSIRLTSSTQRAPRPDDLYRLHIPTDPRLAPDGRAVFCVVGESAPAHDGYRSAIWRVGLGPGGAVVRPPERVTIGARRDTNPRVSPDGSTLAFLSDRRTLVEEELGAPRDREDGRQVHLLPLDRPGEARRLTNLPRGVDAFAWSPDGTRLAIVSSSREAGRAADDYARRRLKDPGPDRPPASDYWFFDRLFYLANGAGVVAGRTPQLWVVDVVSGHARRLTNLAAGVGNPAWSPDGRRIAITTGRGHADDLVSFHRVLVVDVDSGRHIPVAEHRHGLFSHAAWLGSGSEIAVLGGQLPHAFYRTDIWVFPADGSDPAGGRNLSGRHDIMPGSSMNSDVATDEEARLLATADGRSVVFTAPADGAMEAWRIDIGDGGLERLTSDRHYLSAIDIADRGSEGLSIAAICSTPTALPEVFVGRVPAAAHANGRSTKGQSTKGRSGEGGAPVALHPASSFNGDLQGELALRSPVERTTMVEGRSIHGWLIAAGDGTRPTVVEIHGGPHTLYGWAPMLEFQILAASGMSVFYCNPRGSEGYGLAFNEANLADWGDGPMRDVLAGVDALVADGLADPDRLGVTGGSYGGYLTSWIIGHDTRFRAAFTARSVTDLSMLMLTGDLGGTDWAKMELGAYPWEDPDLYRRLSPLTYARDIRTPLLIQHADQDLRTTIGQAEALFTVLRKHRRPVRMMRVPGESHELTRSGTPFRRAENLVQVRDWFAHFLVAGGRSLPRMPRTRHGE